MTNKETNNKQNHNNFHLSLSEFVGTELYYFRQPFKNIHYTEGVKYFIDNAGNGANWFLVLVATEIIPILKPEFYFIELTVNQDETAKIIVQRDEGQPILYEKDLKYTDCPPCSEPYKFCLDVNSENSILCLLSEY